ATYDQPIIIKKVKKAAHAHHGGAWKIAYADFVTAMMAFFLMLWLISMTTEEQKKGLADYFAPASVSASFSGAGGVLGGTAFDTSGAKTSDVVSKKFGVSTNNSNDGMTSITGADSGVQQKTESTPDSGKSSTTDLKSKYDQNFQSAAASIRQAWQAMPNITQIEDNLRVEQTEEGLNIEIVDQRGRPMFPEGSKFPFEMTRQAIAALAPVLQRLPNQITIEGHTAAGGTYSDPRYGSWELSSDRANVVRSILGEFGLSDDHIHSVSGRSTSQPYFPSDPYLAPNERIEITLLYAAPPVPPDMKP
ncbi:MAG: flagellar motor protein MotB, partial [Devosia sp.]